MTLNPGLRKFMFTVHVVFSVGWIGAVAAYLVLDITASTSEDLQRLRAAFLSMEMITQWAIVPLAFASLVTGLIMALGTKWGLFRHYWVVISLLLTVFAIIILMVETQTISQFASIAADPESPDDELRALPGTLVHSAGGMLVLLVILILNVYKPRGLTRYGWRKRREEFGAEKTGQGVIA